MARKRMIDPSLWDSEQVQALTPTQFKMYIYLISNADDEGRFKINFKMIAAKAMPLEENYKAEECRNDIAELHRDGLVYIYVDTDGSIYGEHPNWTRYQKINRPQPSHIPPPEGLTPFIERSLNDHGTINESSVNDHGTLTPNRIERNRKEQKLANADAPAQPQPTVSALKDEVADDWQSILTGKAPPSTWSNHGKERKACITLAARTRELVDQTPYADHRELIKAVLSEYDRQKRKARTDYWRTAEWTPSAVLTRWAAVWESLRQGHEVEEAMIF